MKVSVHHAWRRTLAALCLATGCLVTSSAAAQAAAPVVEQESVVAVSADSATLQAQVDPEGAATSYRFEYDTSAYAAGAAHGTSVPAPEGDAGAGSSTATVTVHLQGLTPATVYHFRVVLTSGAGVVDGADATFTTQAPGGQSTLPDGRQWEMVSPPIKEGAKFEAIQSFGGVVQAAAGGNAITYLAFAPTEANPAGNMGANQIVSTRNSAGGWASQDIATPHDKASTVTTTGEGDEYRFFSNDLSLSLVEPAGNSEPPLSTRATERTMYVRDDPPLQPATGAQTVFAEAEAEALAGAHGVGYLPLVSPIDVALGTKFGATWPSGVSFLGATPDLSHSVIVSPSPLVMGAPSGGLYEWSDGQLLPVSVLPGPGGEFVGSDTLGGPQSYDARNAISADGSRIFWEHETALYLREMTTGETVQVSAGQGALQPKGGAVFETANADGSTVFFKEEGDLYEFTVDAGSDPLAGTLADLTDDPGNATEMQGAILGASEDGSYVYLVANGVLGNGAERGATPGNCRESGGGGACNLYVLHDTEAGWTTTFIAQLTTDEQNDWLGANGGDLSTMTARVSPDGRYLAFMSDSSLTGYDNVDANSGIRDQEVYLYDAASQRLVCASCQPTGARPVGIDDGRLAGAESPLLDHQGIWVGHWLAANVPGWTEMGHGQARHQPRYLSDSGRLFFNSADPLVPQATNGVADVYEYEPARVGSCLASSPTFAPAANGCLALISAGSSGTESVFLDANEAGSDVFFLTTARLAGQDLDSSFDVYDAHICSAGTPCPEPAVLPPPCTTADSCRAAPSPQPAIFGAPASATFSGAGNHISVTGAVTAKTANPSKQKAKKQHANAKHRPRAKRKRKLGSHNGKASHAAHRRSRGPVNRPGKSSSSVRTER